MKSGHPTATLFARLPVVFATRLEKPVSLGWHSHREIQWVSAGSGVVTVETEDAKWIALPGEALTIGSHVLHNINWFGPAFVTTVYLEPKALTLDPSSACVLTSVTPLLAAAAEELVKEGGTSTENETHRTNVIAALVVNDIPRRGQPPYRLPLPGGALRMLCRELLDQPSDERNLDDCAQSVRMSRRTFTRQFRLKTGMSFVDWRRRLRVVHAIELRMTGMPSKRIAEIVGYDSVQSLHAGVKKVCGRTLGDIEGSHPPHP